MIPEDNKQQLAISYCDLAFKEGSWSNDETANFKKIVGFMCQIKLHVPYEEITKKIFALDDDQTETIYQSISEKLDSAKDTENTYQVKLYDDTLRHIQLAITQKKYIDNHLKKASSELSEIDNVRKNIYTDFITILGVFTAITFATFGGLNLIGNVFGKISTAKSSNVGGVMMMGAVYLLCTYFLLAALLTGVSKLTVGKYELSESTCRLVIYGCIIIFILGFYLQIASNVVALSGVSVVAFLVILRVAIIIYKQSHRDS